MSGNTFGQNFTVTTCGESHGPGLIAIVDGCPPGLELSESDIQRDLDMRKPGRNPFTTPRKEDDRVEIISGVFEGRTTGTPIGLLIRNENQRSGDYSDIMNKFRPGHADFSYQQKYGLRDYRGGGRASARETAMRVAAGAIAKKYLGSRAGIKIRGCLIQIGSVKADFCNLEQVYGNPFFFADPQKINEVEEYLRELKKSGDSVGAIVKVVADGVPVGLGEPVFDRLDADLAYAMMGINAVKGVEIGDGFAVAEQRGSAHRDLIDKTGFLSNHDGGILGGISNGNPIEVTVAFKPTSSILIPGETIDIDGNSAEIVTRGRHDPCVGIRAVPIVEAMMALVLMDHFLRDRAQNADVNRRMYF